MKKHAIQSRLTALLLAALLLLSACGMQEVFREIGNAMQQEVTRADVQKEQPQEPVRDKPAEETVPDVPGAGRWSTLAMVPFNEMPYEAPDMDAFRAETGRVAELLDDGASAEAVAEQVSRCDAAYFSFYTMYTLAELRYYQDVTDQAYSDAYETCAAEVNQVERLMQEAYTACADSPLCRELESIYFGENGLDGYHSEEQSMDSEAIAAYYELADQEAQLLSDYRAAVSNPTVEVDGEEVSYQEALADPSLDTADYNALQSAYYDKYTQVLGGIYLELVGVRNEMAQVAGYESYEAYAFDLVYGRDYTPEEADAFAADVRTSITPLYREILESGHWTSADDIPSTEEETVSAVSALANSLGGSIQEAWAFVDYYGLYDVRISSNKLDTSFETYLEDYEAPFAIVKTYGTGADQLSFAHEFGHCVDAYVNNNDTASLELCETFSQAMEYLLISERGDTALTRAKLFDTLDTYAQQSSFHDFEKQVYALPEEERTVEKLNEISLQTAIDYGYFQEGEEDYYAKSWIDISHFFEQPFYVISYCISNDAAFQIYQMEQAQPGTGAAQYEALLPRDYQGFLETLDAQSTLESPFAAGRMESTAALIRENLGL